MTIRIRKVIAIVLGFLIAFGVIPSPMTGSGVVYAADTVNSKSASIDKGTTTVTTGYNYPDAQLYLDSTNIPIGNLYFNGVKVEGLGTFNTTTYGGPISIRDIPADQAPGVYNFSWVYDDSSETPNIVNNFTLTIVEKVKPTVTTGNHANVAATTATITGSNVTADGGAPVTSKGIAYGTSSSPTAEAYFGTGTGAFDVNLSGLIANTTYYYRAYATNSVGTSYGNESSFTTVATKPSVSVAAASLISTTSATMNGNILTNGGSAITGKGFKYSNTLTTQGELIASGTNQIIAGAAIGGYSHTLVGLLPGVRYYYIAYATNAIGTENSGVQPFTTLVGNPDVTLIATLDSVTVSWAAIDGALSYNVYVDGNGAPINVAVGTSYTHNGLVPNTQHSYKVEAVGQDTNSLNDSAKSIYTLAQVPSITSANPLQNGSVVLTIDKKSNSANTKYYIEKSQNANFTDATLVMNYATLAGTTVTVPKSVNDESIGVVPAKNYYFRIKAENSEATPVETAFSDSASCLTVPEIPGAPTLTPDSDSQMTVSWPLVTGATSYDVYQDNVRVGTDVVGTSNIRTGLTPNTRYTYEISSKNASGDSVRSNATSNYTLASVPDMVSVEPQANGDLVLTMDKKSNPNITEYKIEQSTRADFSENLTTARDWNTFAGGASTFTVNAATVNDDTTYYFRIKARNGDQVESAYGVVQNGLTVPPVPGQPAITVNSNTQLTITWPAVVNVDTDPILYDLYVSINGGGYSLVHGSILVPDSENPAFIHTGLIPNTSYTYYVRSRNASGVSTNSAIIEDATFATVPDVSQVLAKADGTVTLTLDEYDNPGITEYYVQKATDPSFTNPTLALTWTNPSGNHEVTLTGLTRGTLYYFRVMARNQDNDETAYGPTIGSIRTIPGDIGNAPTATAVSTSQINISWNSVFGATTYDLYRDGAYVKNVATTTTSDTGLSPNEGNQYTIISRNSSGISVNASPASAIKYTFTNTPGIELVARANGTIVDVTIDEKNNSTGAQYFIEYGVAADFSGATQVTWNMTNNPTINGLTQGQMYYFRVKARNGNNGANTTQESSWSVTSTITMPLAQVSQPTITPISDTELGISWGAVVNAAQYKIYKNGVYLATVAGLSYTDTGLKANKAYSYEISALNAIGLENTKSVSATGRTLADYPESIAITNRTKTSIEFTITPPNHIGDPQKYQLILKDTANIQPNITLAYSTDLIYLLEGMDNTVEYEVWIGIRNNDNVSEPAIKMLDSAYANRDVIGVITNNTNSTRSEVSGHNNDFNLELKVFDPDGDSVTVSATIAGIKREVTITAPKTVPASANVVLSWDIFSLPEATYSNVVVTLKDTYDSETTATYTSNLIVDKTKPTTTLIGDADIYLFVEDVYVDANPGANAVNADGNPIVVTGVDLVDTSTVGVYTITYTATDLAGNSDFKTRNIHVVEPTSINDATLDNIGATGVTFFGEILSLGKTNNATEYGFVYGTSVDSDFEPTVADTKVDLKPTQAPQIGSYSKDITGLTAETTYYVRSYILDGDNADEPIYGETVTFDTIALVDEKARFSVDALTYSGVEGSTITVTINRSVVTAGEMTVTYNLVGLTAASGSDFTAATGTITFADTDTSKTINIVTLEDALFESNETLNCVLSNPSDSGILINSTALVTITDNDVANTNNKIASFDLTGSIAAATIDHNAETITLTVANGTDLTQVIPVALTLEAPATSTVSPEFNIPRDFTSPVAYTVTAQDGTTKRYIVSISVQPLNTDSTLSNLVVLNGATPLTLSPSFSSDTVEYSMTVTNDVDSLTINPTLTEGTSSVIIKKDNVQDDSVVSLSVGNQVIQVIVTAEDGSIRTYRITVTRQPAASSSNAFLQSLTLDTAGIAPAFDKTVKNYTLTVANTITSLMVNASPEDSSSNMVISANGVVINSGSTFSLETGSNLLRITVTSTNGTENVYAVAITRTIAQNQGSGGSSGGGAGGGTNVPIPEDSSSDKKVQTGKIADPETSGEINKKITDSPKGDGTEKTVPKGPILQFGDPNKEVPTGDDPSTPKVPTPDDFTKKSITLSPKENPIPDDEDVKKYTVGRIDPVTGKITPVTGTITKNKDGSVDIDVFDKGDGYYTLIKNSTNYVREGQEDHWAKDVAEVAASKYLLGDILGNNINLNGEITRAEAAAIMVKLMAIDISVYKLKSGFNDVNQDHALEAYLSIASRFGIVNGYGDGSFRPNQIVTREEMAVIVYNTVSYLRLINLSAQSKAYQDDGMISRWSYGQVHTLTKLEILKGTPMGDFVPRKDMTMGEVLQMFFNIDLYLIQ